MTVKSASITKRTRTRTLSDGSKAVQVRWIVNFTDPNSGKRAQRFFERHKDALEARDEIARAVAEGSYRRRRDVPTVKEAVDHWLNDRRGQIKPRSYRYYLVIADYICGPLLLGTPEQRAELKTHGIKPPGARFRRMLGHSKVNELTTGEIRSWHKILIDEVGKASADRAKSHLSTILALAAEDFGVRVPTMPRQIGRGTPKPKKPILTLEQVGKLLEAANDDLDWGIYYAWPFLTGTRPSEQLGLLWSEVDFDHNVIGICRMQEMNGTLTEVTKTEAGMREVPMPEKLRRMLMEWKLRCPRTGGELYRVFPGKGQLPRWPSSVRPGGGGPLYYPHFRTRVWHPALKQIGLPPVTPHSARHLFISAMQAQGVEVGLVSKLAGHSNPKITLSHYTQAVRGGAEAVEALVGAYAAR